MSFEIVQDSVVIQLTAEKSIPTDTVKVSVGIRMSVTAAEAVDVRTTITGKLKTLLDAEWSLTSLDRRPDDSGREIVSAAAVARVSESAAAGLAHKATQASVEGFKITAGPVDYTPPRNVVAEAKKELRKKLYEMASEECELLQQVLTSNAADRQWRVAGVDFNDTPYVAQNNVLRGKGLEAASYMATSNAAPGGGGEEVGLTQKVSLFASVTMARVVVNPVD
jgi:hypothetical protein